MLQYIHNQYCRSSYQVSGVFLLNCNCYLSISTCLTAKMLCVMSNCHLLKIMVTTSCLVNWFPPSWCCARCKKENFWSSWLKSKGVVAVPFVAFALWINIREVTTYMYVLSALLIYAPSVVLADVHSHFV